MINANGRPRKQMKLSYYLTPNKLATTSLKCRTVLGRAELPHSYSAGGTVNWCNHLRKRLSNICQSHKNVHILIWVILIDYAEPKVKTLPFSLEKASWVTAAGDTEDGSAEQTDLGLPVGQQVRYGNCWQLKLFHHDRYFKLSFPNTVYLGGCRCATVSAGDLNFDPRCFHWRIGAQLGRRLPGAQASAGQLDICLRCFGFLQLIYLNKTNNQVRKRGRI